MSNKNVARDSERSSRGVIVHISRKNLLWYRRFVSSYQKPDLYDQLLSQDELIMKQMDVKTDRGTTKQFKITRKQGSVYRIELFYERKLNKKRNHPEKHNVDSYTVDYDAKNGGLSFIRSDWNNEQTDIYEQARRHCEDIMTIMYYIYVTGFEIEDGKVYILERFSMFGFEPKDLI